MSEKYSPDPWAAVEHSWSDTSIYAGNKPIALLSIESIATEETQTILAAKMDANARLIAAAPDMLAALEEMVGWLSTFVGLEAMSRFTSSPENNEGQSAVSLNCWLILGPNR